jgi:EAL domain-containing protein (putative c-di-GMP-specific phosphodiesterase class I)
MPGFWDARMSDGFCREGWPCIEHSGAEIRLRLSMNYPTTQPKQALLDFSDIDALRGIVAEDLGHWFIVRRSENGDDQHRTLVVGITFTVGRRPKSNLCLSHQTVSGHHAELRREGEDLLLVDVGSTNGTLLNGVRVREPKTLHHGDVVHFGQMVFAIEYKPPQLSSLNDLQNKTFVASIPEDAVLYQGFDRLLNKPDIDPYFQPIVDLRNGSTIGYEVLVRSRIKGLEFPDRIFRIAAMRTSEARLSEVCRSEGLLSGIQLDPNGTYFLNTHAAELETRRLFESLRELRHDYPNMSIVLEIHEAAITSVAYLTELMALLRELEIDLAYDDFGAGQARLIELFEVPPKYLKFDLSFIRGLEHASQLHRSSVRALLNVVHDLDVIALAEGVETQAQSDICRELGFDMVQGYLYGRPQPREYWLRTIVSAPTLDFTTPSPKQN